jgi:hypothetical protein
MTTHPRSLLRISLLVTVGFLAAACGGSSSAKDSGVDSGSPVDAAADATGADLADGQPDTTSATVDAADGTAPADAPRDAVADELTNPTITQLTPSSLPVGSVGFTLLVDGQDFPPDAFVSFDGNPFTATVVSATRVSAQIPSAALGATPRQIPVLVTRTANPPLRSNTLQFEVTAQ